jgi:hypothetical protein
MCELPEVRASVNRDAMAAERVASLVIGMRAFRRDTWRL